VCWDWGVNDWASVYALPVNALFAARYPDPDVIDFVDTSVFFYIPLPGASTAVQWKGRRLGNALRVLFRERDGSSISVAPSANPKKELYIIDGPGTSGLEWIQADLTIPNVVSGTWTVKSARRLLVGATSTMSAADRRILVTSDPTAGLSSVTPTVGTLLTVDTRKIFWLECPMCRNVYALREKASDEATATCPNDGWDLDDAAAEIDWDTEDWTTPASTTSMDTIAAADVRSRGTYTLNIASFGSVKVFWDESRFANWEAGDYTMAKQDGSLSVEIVGRTTWGAAAPIRTQPDDAWTFHELLAANVPAEHDVYQTAIPNLQNIRIIDSVWFLTLHHASDSYNKQSGYDYPLHNQEKHQTEENNADLGYHYLIDESGVIYEGRPLSLKGSHAEGFNSYNIGIQLSGQFQTWPSSDNLGDPVVDTGGPTAAQEAAATALLRVLSDRLATRDLQPHSQRKIQAHRGGTACPGNYAMPAVARIQSAL
jgi:hypothetical protein